MVVGYAYKSRVGCMVLFEKLAGFEFTQENLVEFIKEASINTYAGGGSYESQPERPGFYELVYANEKWGYRDSYSGFFRSRGMEVVRYQERPVWASMYGGGMIDALVTKEFARETFSFLKKALSADNKGFVSFRGPETMTIGKWRYEYTQSGDVLEFEGHESIFYQRKQVFGHTIIGGIIRK